MSKIYSHYLSMLSPTVLVSAIAASDVTFKEATSLNEPVTVLRYLAKTQDAKALVKNQGELITQIKTEIENNLALNDLTAGEATQLLESVADYASSQPAPAPAPVERKKRQPKAEKVVVDDAAATA